MAVTGATYLSFALILGSELLCRDLYFLWPLIKIDWLWLH